MRIQIEGLVGYHIERKPMPNRSYRDLVTVVELNEAGYPTGRVWPEPFDPVGGSEEELQERFQRRIDTGAPPPVRRSPEPPVEVVVRDAIQPLVKQAINEIIPRIAKIAYTVAEDGVEMAMDARTVRARLKRRFRRK